MSEPIGRLSIDGLNVCYGFAKKQTKGGRRRTPDAYGLYLCLHVLHSFFGIEAIIVLPSYTKRTSFFVKNRHILTVLDEYALVRFVDCKRRGMDDLTAIKGAQAEKGYVVSKDKFRDHGKADPELDAWLCAHRISFSATPDWTLVFTKSDDFLLNIGQRQRQTETFKRTREALGKLNHDQPCPAASIEPSSDVSAVEVDGRQRESTSFSRAHFGFQPEDIGIGFLAPDAAPHRVVVAAEDRSCRDTSTRNGPTFNGTGLRARQYVTTDERDDSIRGFIRSAADCFHPESVPVHRVEWSLGKLNMLPSAPIIDFLRAVPELDVFEEGGNWYFKVRVAPVLGRSCT